MLAPIRDADAEDLAPLYADPAVRDFLGVHGDPRDMVRGARRAWEVAGYGLFIVREVRDGRPVGIAGFINSSLEDGGQAELIYAVLPSARGNRYAGEAAEAAIRWFFDAHRFNKFVLPREPLQPDERGHREGIGFSRHW